MLDLRRALVLAMSALFVACSGDRDPVSSGAETVGPETTAAQSQDPSPATTAPEFEAALTALAERVEAQVTAERPDVALPGLWWTGDPAAGAMGGEVLFSDRGNKRLGLEWVAGDPRRNGRTDIGYAFGHPAFAHAPAGLTVADIEGAVDRAMATWGGQRCSAGLTIPKGTFLDWSLADSDILHAGFTSLSPGVLGVTLPFAFINPSTGVPTDIDGDGNDDYAFAVILYSNAVPWAIDDNFDVETVALHEAGHGLAQAHFGALLQTTRNGRFHFAPRSVMNAGYTGVQQVLTGTDEAGHCGLYGSWPVG